MIIHRIAGMAACAFIAMGFAVPVLAQDRPGGGFSLNAVVGGALPYSTGAGYVVTRLISPDAEARGIDFTRSQPFGAGVKDVFDARPQVGLGGRYELGRSGGAKIALKAMVSAGMERPEGERPMIGLAGISLIF